MTHHCADPSAGVHSALCLTTFELCPLIYLHMVLTTRDTSVEFRSLSSLTPGKKKERARKPAPSKTWPRRRLPRLSNTCLEQQKASIASGKVDVAATAVNATNQNKKSGTSKTTANNGNKAANGASKGTKRQPSKKTCFSFFSSLAFLLNSCRCRAT